MIKTFLAILATVILLAVVIFRPTEKQTARPMPEYVNGLPVLRQCKELPTDLFGSCRK